MQETSAERGIEYDAHLLKFVIVVWNCPFASAVTAVEESIFWATLTLPQGRAFDGRCTSFRTGVPCTPNMGAMAAWARTSRERLRQSATAATRLFEKNIVPDFGGRKCDQARRAKKSERKKGKENMNR